MRRKSFRLIGVASLAFAALGGGAFAAEIAKPQTASERYYAQRNIAQDSDSGAVPPAENALAPEADTADAIPSPARTLGSLPVRSREGETVGFVESVDVGSNGHARTLQVAIGGKIVALRADQVLYDPSKRSAVTALTRDAILAVANGDGMTTSLGPRLY